MRIASIAAVALLLLGGAADGAVHTFNAAQLAALAAGNPIPGVEDASIQPHSLWVVRFAMPWDTTNSSESAQAFEAASSAVPAACVRFAEVPLATRAELAMADAMSFSKLPAIRAYHGAVARPTVPRGSQLTGRPVTTRPPLAANEVGNTESITRYAMESIPSNWADPVTDALYASAQVVKDESALPKLAASLHQTVADVAASSPEVAIKADTVTHALVLVSSLRSRDKFTAEAVAAATATGAALRGRGGTHVLLGDSSGFSNWAPEKDGEAIIVPVRATSKGYDKNSAAGRIKVTSADDVAKTIIEYADKVESTADLHESRKARIANAQKGAPRYLAPATATAYPIRRIDTGAHFQKHVTELKVGAAVVFFMRESDKFYGKAVKIAREIAESARKDPTATIGDAKQPFGFEVFMIDAEVHKDVARELRVPQVPSVGFFMEMQKSEGKKGVRYFPARELNKAKDIDKFMREELFNGRDTTLMDTTKVHFNPNVPASPVDLSLQSDYFDTDPRRFNSEVTDTVLPELDRALGRWRKSSEPSEAEKKKKKIPKNETPKQKAKREAREAKEKEREDAKKAKLKAELEAKEAKKKERMEARKKEEAQLAAKRKEDATKRAEEAKERRAREEADGTAARRRAAAKAKKARLERLAKLKKAKLAAKEPKDRKTMLNLWVEDNKQAAEMYTVVGEDGSLSVLDRLL